MFIQLNMFFCQCSYYFLIHQFPSVSLGLPFVNPCDSNTVTHLGLALHPGQRKSGCQQEQPGTVTLLTVVQIWLPTLSNVLCK